MGGQGSGPQKGGQRVVKRQTVAGRKSESRKKPGRITGLRSSDKRTGTKKSKGPSPLSGFKLK